MRERQRLDESMSAVRKLEAELLDAQGLMEMAEAENDAAVVGDAEKSIVALSRRAESMDCSRMPCSRARRMQKISR